ncbi:MAG TPA: hypothetical protein VHX59_07225 [Mycobacteriales bacterium]|jgi:hypothetical protein|nr:hypothetical protein [Mycobacteriales bacterium]
MTNNITLLTRLESSAELDRQQADQCAAETVADWITGGRAAIRRLRRAGSAVALASTPRRRHALRSGYRLAASEGER